MSGLLIDGRSVPVPGFEILSPHEIDWVDLDEHDSRPRDNRPQQAILHRTIADDPEVVLAGRGPAGGDEDVARMWHKDLKSSGAQLVTSCSGRTACLVDLCRFAAWHDSNYVSNLLAYGHEMKEVKGGGVYQATYDACLEITLVATGGGYYDENGERVGGLGIQWQCPIRYDGKPLKRFANGGLDLVGIFGHRDVTSERNRHDPGDLIFGMLRARGVEAFDFAAGEDLDVWGNRQRWLAREGLYTGKIDGIPGPKTTKALQHLGYPGGIFARHIETLEQLPMPPGYGRR